ncbi:MAG: flagellar filament capping protein FliD [Proteobacteria bacterium]|nr:flagellar filament capping protein FliD [Pseudomonadota bacterium]
MALGSINTSGITVGSDGKLSVSGFSSGIDWKSLIDAQIAAKRAPAVTLENNIKTNNTLATAYGDLKTKVQAVTTALDALRGAPGSTTNVFNAKTASGTTAALDTAPSGFVPSSVDSLVLTSISNTAQAATHTFTIEQLAQAHQIRTGSFSSTTTALSGLGATAGTFSINGQNIVVSASSTLLDLKSAINNSGAGVTATIVSADAATNYLVLTSNTTGEDNAMTLGGDGATLDSLGLTTGSGTVIANELKPAKNAIIDVDGIPGIERQTNQISDVIDGVTLSLLKGEPNTEITLKIEPDLNTIKTAVGNFVTAYNDLRTFYTDQRTASDRNGDGTVDPNEVGPLAYDSMMREVMGKLGDIMATSVDSAADGYQSLSQIGVVVQQDYSLAIDDSIIDSKLLTNVDQVKKLFTFSSSVSDSRVTVLGRTADTANGTYYLNVAGTDVDGNITDANLQTSAGAGSGGASDGSVTLAGKSLIANDTTAANGLQLFFSGGASLGSVDDIAVTVTRGVADQFYDYFNSVTTATTGRIDTLVTNLQSQNTDYQNRVDTIDARLETTRSTLEAKFTAMETALAKLQSVQSTVQGFIDAGNKSSN